MAFASLVVFPGPKVKNTKRSQWGKRIKSWKITRPGRRMLFWFVFSLHSYYVSRMGQILKRAEGAGWWRRVKMAAPVRIQSLGPGSQEGQRGGLAELSPPRETNFVWQPNLSSRQTRWNRVPCISHSSHPLQLYDRVRHWTKRKIFFVAMLCNMWNLF